MVANKYGVSQRLIAKRVDHSGDDPHLGDDLWVEYGVHQRLHQRGCKNILGVRGFSTRADVKVALLYLDYAPGIDLIKLIDLNCQEYALLDLDMDSSISYSLTAK